MNLKYSQSAANLTGVASEAAQMAVEAGLIYVSDAEPGIRRLRAGKGFRYLTPENRRLGATKELKRIASLAIPPAYRNVWISLQSRGHLQATGRDARGRKQYRYHSSWREVRDSTKYHRMISFGKTLPKIRARVAHDLQQTTLSRDKVLATIVRLLEITSIRVGNEEYMKQNQSYGLTTLRDRHVHIAGNTIDFYFQGKSGIRHHISVQNRHLARIVKRCRDVPGCELFQYVDGNGERHSVDSADVNNYIHEIGSSDFTAKDFRTWNGTVLAATTLAALEPFRSQSQAKRNMVIAIQSVAGHLGNTVAVCRKCYVHPAIFDAYTARTLCLRSAKPVPGLSAEESAVLCFLQKSATVKIRRWPVHLT
jgi:DNA topoisomerase I